MVDNGSAYDDAMRVVCDLVQSQMMWQSERTLEMDLRRALTILVADREHSPDQCNLTPLTSDTAPQGEK